MTIYNKNIQCQPLLMGPFQTFELQLFQIVATNPVTAGVIYQPPKPNRMFVKEFSDLLSEMSIKYDCFMPLGDFNVHICCGKDTLLYEFANLIESFDLVQWVNSPTH